MKKVYFYMRTPCGLCDEALTIVRLLQNMYDFELELRDIESREDWFEAFHLEIPVLEGAGKFLLGNEMTYDEIEGFLRDL